MSRSGWHRPPRVLSKRVCLAVVGLVLGIQIDLALPMSAVPPPSSGAALPHEKSVLDATWRLGTWKLQSRLLLAPMRSVTDCAYRKLCTELGAGFTWTEMVRAKDVAALNYDSWDAIDTADPGTLTGVQLLARNAGELRDALRNIDANAEGYRSHWADGIHGIELNLGCPDSEVCALLPRSKKLREIFEALAEWRGTTRLPIGVIGAKIRLALNQKGVWRKDWKAALRRATGLLDYVTIHPRTADSDYSTPADWDYIAMSKDYVGDELTILGSGDVYTREDAIRMVEKTGCDGVVVARGAIRTGGLIFSSQYSWDTSIADNLRGRYFDLAKTFRGPRPECKRFHSQAFQKMIDGDLDLRKFVDKKGRSVVSG